MKEVSMVGAGIVLLLAGLACLWIGHSLEGGGDLFALADLIPKTLGAALLVAGSIFIFIGRG